MAVDSFKFLPRLIAAYYRMMKQDPRFPIPWTPLPGPLSACRFGLITTGGFYHKGIEPPFDIDREKKEPRWGDPTYRIIPSDIPQEEVGVSHLHYNPQSALEDINILLPIHHFHELSEMRQIGGLAKNAYSLMGYQGFPSNTEAWRQIYGPEIAERLKAEEVNCALLTPAWPDCALNVPVLAQTLESAGLSTILVTMMPYWVERIGAPRTLAVEFPFGHTLGQPHHASQQMRVIRHALNVLESADTPGTIIHSPEVWPVPREEAMVAWQPTEPSPIIAELTPQILKIMRQRRREES